MSVSVPPAYPITLQQLNKIILTTNTCIGSPFITSKSCSQPLIRSPNAKSLSSVKDELEDILNSMNGDVIAITTKTISTLKKIAKSCTCDDHQKKSDDFAYHWLASSRIDGFLKHMEWSADAVNWKCLASKNPSCRSVLDCFSSTKLHDTVRGLLNRIAIGVERYKSLRELARYWFCQQHQANTDLMKKAIEKALKNVREQCRVYWSSNGLCEERARRSNSRTNRDISNPGNDSSCYDSSVDDSINFDPTDTVISTKKDIVNQTNTLPSILVSNTTRNAGVASNPLPWNNLGIYADDGEYKSQADFHLDTLGSVSSHEAPPISPSSTIQANSDRTRSSETPSISDTDPASIAIEASVQTRCSSRNTSRPLTPDVSQAPSKSSNIQPKPFPLFMRCEAVSNATVFHETFKLIKKPNFKTGVVDYGYIYVELAVRSPNHIKIGRTDQTIRKRGKQISRCVGPLDQINERYNAFKVPQHNSLEKIILNSLMSRKCSLICLHKGNNSEKSVGHREWVGVDANEDANEIADHVQRCREWWLSEPYDSSGHLLSKWQMRIAFFETSTSRYPYLLDESSPYKAWSTFFDPPWWIRVQMILFEIFFCRRGNLSCRWTLIRENWKEIAYHTAFGSAAVLVTLMYSGYSWILNPATLHLIFLGILCCLVWSL